MKKRKYRIPTFTSIAEEAKFWDTHSIADYWNELTPVEVEYKPEPEKKEVMPIRIPPSVKKQIRNVAKSYDISPSTLVRMWIVDKLKETIETEYKA